MTSEEKLLAQQVSLLTRIEMIAKSIDKNLSRERDISNITASPEEKAKELDSKGSNGTGVAFASSIETTINAIKEYDKSTAKKGTDFVTFIQDITNIFANKKKSELISKNLDILSKSLDTLSKEITGKLSESLDKLNDLTEKYAKGSKKFDIQQSISNLTATGDGILQFSKKAALASVFMGPALLGLKLFSLGIPMINKAFDYISSNEKDINKGSKSLAIMGGALIIFAGSIAISTLIMASMGTESLVSGGVLFLTLGVSALVFNIVGKYGKDIAKGAISVLLMSGSIALFTLAYTMSSKMIQDTNPLLLMGAVAGTALVFGIAGIFWKQIALGALGIGIAGLALMIFSPGYQKMAESIAVNPDAMWQVPAAIIGIGGAFALAGLGPIPLAIGAGAIALGLAGGALWIIAKGISTFNNVDTNTADKVKYGIQATVDGFVGAFENVSISDMLTLPIKIPLVGLMGLSLATLGMGLSKYKSYAGDWSEQDADKLAFTVNSIGRAFAAAGSIEGMNEIFGFKVGENAVERGIESVEDVGDTLESLSRGILAWKDKISQEDLDKVTHNISHVLSTIPMVFAKIGGIERESMEYFWSDGDVENGIESVESLGTTLESLSHGILAWKDKINEKDIDLITSNLLKLLGTVPSAFAEIGKTDRESSGIFPWSEGDVENGIELVNDLSPSIQAFADLLNAVKGEDAVKKGQGISQSIIDITSGYAQASVIAEKIKDNKMKSVVDYLDKMAKLSTPLDKLSKSFTSFNTQFKKHIDIINDIKPENIASISKWGDALAQLSKADTALLETNLGTANQIKDVPLTPVPVMQPAQYSRSAQPVQPKPVQVVTPTQVQTTKKNTDTDKDKMIEMLMANLSEMTKVLVAIQKDQAAIKNQLLSGTINTKNSML